MAIKTALIPCTEYSPVIMTAFALQTSNDFAPQRRGGGGGGLGALWTRGGGGAIVSELSGAERKEENIYRSCNVS